MCAAVLIASPTLADTTDDWQFEATPYLIMAGMDGEIGLRGHTADVDASFGDILDNLEAGFMGMITAQQGPWTAGFDFIYMKLKTEDSFDISGPLGIISVGGDLEVVSKLTVWQASLGYRIFDDTTEVDLIGAVRYTDLDMDMKVTATFAPLPFGGSRKASGSESWVDAVVGTRVVHPVSENVSLIGYADIGAGGSDLTYQLAAGLNWEFSEGFVAKVGYRGIYWDYEDGGTVWDITASGPYLGLGIRF